MNLWYLVPLENRFISVLQPSQARNWPVACNLFNLHKGITLSCACVVTVNLLGTTSYNKLRQYGL